MRSSSSRGEDRIPSYQAQPTSSNIHYSKALKHPDSAASQVSTGQSPDTNVMENAEIPYPVRLYECKGRVVLIFEHLKCGILNLEGADQRKAYCLFFFKDTFLINKEASELPVGKKLNTNARLISGRDKIPYLASTVWDIGLDVPPRAMVKMFQELNYEDVQSYHQFAKDLTWKLPSTDAPNDKPIPVLTVSLSSDEEVAAAESGSEHHAKSYQSDEECVMVDEVKRKKKRKKEKKKKKKTLKDEHKKKRKRSKSESRSPEREQKIRKIKQQLNILSEEIDSKVSKKEKIFPKHNYDVNQNKYEGHISSYINDEFGIIEVVNKSGKMKVYFHFNQVWIGHANTKLQPFKEIFPIKQLRRLFLVNQEIQCVVRPIKGSDRDLQAVAVWQVSKSSKLPPFYLDEDLELDLNYQLSVLKYFDVKDKKCLNIDPLPLKDKARTGIVQEYFSDEVGLIRIDGAEQAIVIFHLNEVWCMDGSTKLFKTKQDTMLDKYLPVGTKVDVITRKIPCSRFSELKYQAIGVWKPSKSAYSSFQQNHSLIDNKILLHTKLEKQYNAFKTLACLDLDPWKRNFPLVHAVLFELPDKWNAHIHHIISSTSALIKVTYLKKELSTNSSSPEEKTPRFGYFLVLCHISDIYDEFGVKLLDQGKNLASVTKCRVNLIARSISDRLVPEDIMEFIEEIKNSSIWQHQPILQAIVVQVTKENTSEYFSESVPFPTVLKQSPGNFGKLKLSYYYTNFLLKSQLDLKLSTYLSLSKTTEVFASTINPYWVAPTLKKEQEMVDQLLKVDSNFSSRILYGNINTNSLWKAQSSIPLFKSLQSVYCRPVYLHREGLFSRSGIVEFYLPNSNNTACYAYFDVPTFHHFSTFVKKTENEESDLIHLIAVNSTKLYRASFSLYDQNYCVPYLTTIIWNEDERMLLKETIPYPKHTNQESQIFKLKKVISCKSDDIEVIEEISTSKMSGEEKVKKDITCKNEVVSLHPSEVDLPDNDSSSIVITTGTSANSLAVRSDLFQTQEDNKSFPFCESEPPCVDNSSGDSIYLPTMIPIPAEVPVCFEETFVDINSLVTVNDDIVTSMSNCTGKVEKILGSNYAVVSFEHSDNGVLSKKRILCSTCDILNSSDFIESLDDLKTSRIALASNNKVLADVLVEGMVVRFNASVLIAESQSQISYFCTCLCYHDDLSKSLPFHPLKSSQGASAQWKHQYSKILRLLNADLKPGMPALDWNSLMIEPPPSKFSKEVHTSLIKMSSQTGSIEAEFFFHPIAETESLPSTSSKSPEELVGLGSGELKRCPAALKRIKKEIPSNKFHPEIVIQNVVGKLVKVLSDKFALAIVKEFGNGQSYKVVFDVYDLWMGDLTPDGQTNLFDVLTIGMYVKLHAIQAKVDDFCNLLGTAVIVSTSLEEIKERCLPPQATLAKDLLSFDPTKIVNFNTVARIVQNTEYSDIEKAIILDVESPDMIGMSLKMEPEETLGIVIASSHSIEDKVIPTYNQNDPLLEGTPLELPPATQFTPLPDTVTNVTGIVLLCYSEVAFVKFDFLVTDEVRINCVGVLFKDVLIPTDVDQEDFKVGYPITFHAISLSNNESQVCKNYLITNAYTNGSQATKEKFMMEVAEPTWSQCCKERSDFNEKLRFADKYCQDLGESIKKLPCVLRKTKCKVIKATKDMKTNSYILILKVDQFDFSSHALHVSDNPMIYKENDNVLINAVELSEKSCINYLVTAIWSDGEPDFTAKGYGYIPEELVKTFHGCLLHSEEVLYLTVLISEADLKRSLRMVEILGKYSLQNFKRLISSYLKAVHKKLEIEDFSSVRQVSAPFCLNEIIEESSIKIAVPELLELLILVSKNYQRYHTSGCLQFIDPVDLQSISKLGIRSVMDSLLDVKPGWKIPEDINEQATCMAWEEVVSPPLEGIPDDWSIEHDSSLLEAASIHKILLFGMISNEELWSELLKNPSFMAMGDLLSQGKTTMEFLQKRLIYLKKMMISRGRFFVEDVDTDFASCDIEEEKKGNIGTRIKKEPTVTVKQEEEVPIEEESTTFEFDASEFQNL